VVQYLAVRPQPPAQAELYAIALLLPVALTALVPRAEVRRGHTLWRAGSVAFMVGGTVAALIPLLVVYVSVLLACAVTGDCL
jgi:hypothetical protein